MKRIITIGALLAAACLGLQQDSAGHGGTYRGPGDTVPPGGGNGGGGGAAGRGPAGPSAPDTGSPGTPGATTGPGVAPGQAGQRRGPVDTGAAAAGPDLTLWEFWWGFNKERFLNLKAAIHSAGTQTGDADFFLGQGEKSQARDTLRPSETDIRERVVPALLAALETERHNDIVTACLVGLAKIGDAKGEGGQSGFEPVIRKFLADGNQEISETAAISLGILANEASVPTLRDLLFDSDRGQELVGRRVSTRTRAFAAFGLGLIGNRTSDADVRREIVTILAEMLAGEARSMPLRDVPVACVTALGLVPLDLDPAWVAPELREGAPELAVAECRQSQLAWLTDYYGDEEVSFLTRAHVPTALARLLGDVPESAGLKQGVAEILLADIDRHSKAQRELQQSCVLALGLLGDADSDELDIEIRKALTDVPHNLADVQARHFSLIALAQVGGRPGSSTAGDATAAVPEVRKQLLLQLARGKSSMRRWAALALGLFEKSLADRTGVPASAESAAALRMALDDSNSALAIGANAIGAGILGDLQASEVLLEKLASMRAPGTRGFVCIALGLLGARDAIEPIQSVVEASKYQPDLLKSAAIGLGLLGDKPVADSLVAMLDQARGLASQASIASALGFIGDRRSIEPLIDMLGDQQKTGAARGFAAVALGIVADKEPLPWNAKIAANINYRANTATLTDPAQGTGILDIR